MRLLRRSAMRFALVCALFLLLMAFSAGFPYLSTAGDAHSTADQGMGMQPCVLSFESTGEYLNSAPHESGAAQAAWGILAAVCALLFVAFRQWVFENGSSVPCGFSLVTLHVRLNN